MVDPASPTLLVMAHPLSYLLCGTPRTGSTLLCDLLTSTGVAGRPESYFREPDEHEWARRLGAPVAGDGSFDYRAFVRAAKSAGSTPNGVFAARVMWGTMHRIVGGLDPFPPTRIELDILIDSFGQLLLVHVQRDDVVGQAVSWVRAEQTGYWQEGDRSSAEPRLDFDQIDELVRTNREHNAAWKTWFQRQGIEPYFVRYEDVVADPRDAVQGLLDRLGVELPSDWRPESPHRRQADEINAEWVRRYRAARAPSSRPECEAS
jgi:LPS sulfotransferase NodH